MKEHEHATTKTSDAKSGDGALAKKVYAIYVKEGPPQGGDALPKRYSASRPPRVAATRKPALQMPHSGDCSTRCQRGSLALDGMVDAGSAREINDVLRRGFERTADADESIDL